eukprot:GHRR01018004.1.p1 GENE.GHRR01018004.1~~GHRR01018004.1.p1  ORF type:complete len:472 (+),score=146.34 GHRR01018004.1:264-1679(+)
MMLLSTASMQHGILRCRGRCFGRVASFSPADDRHLKPLGTARQRARLGCWHGSSAAALGSPQWSKSTAGLLACFATSTNEPSSIAVDDVDTESAVRVGWDPNNLLPPLERLGSTDHFARRARQKQQQQQSQQGRQQPEQLNAGTTVQPTAASVAPAQAYSKAVRPAQPSQLQQQTQQLQPPQQQQPTSQPQTTAPPSSSCATASVAAGAAVAVPAAAVPVPAPTPAPFQSSDHIERISARWLSQGGISASDTTGYDRTALLRKLADKFMPINLDYPGLHIVNFDPAIFTVEGFMSAEECSSWRQEAENSGCLQQSRIGAGNAASSSVNVYGSRRTSSSLLLDPPTQAAAPGLVSLMQTCQSRAHQLLAHLDNGRSWGPPGRMPAKGQYCYESPQVARYVAGQHFLSHEDGFPALLATANGFQRHATLLLYLNDVQQGGATLFDHLGISIQPKQGMALLFFPSYANGTADSR